jgi:hypothetical protein
MGSLRNLLSRRVSEEPSEPELRPEPMVRFHGSDIAVCTIQHFFYCLQFAKFGLCAKGWLGYRAGRYPGSRDTMVSLLKRVRDFEMHYIYSPATEAERTLQRFHQYLRNLNNSEILDKVFVWRTGVRKEANDGLRYSISAPFTTRKA